MKTQDYLDRINFSSDNISPTLENLKQLQKQHLLTVPFENLDIHWGRPINLDLHSFYKKVVEKRRGGFCYELNGLFAQLLLSLGFKSRIISARVSNGHGGFGKEFDHLAILTSIEGNDYLTDVGFGDFIAEPLKFVLDFQQKDKNGIYLIRKFDNEYFEVVKKDGKSRVSEYIFKNLTRDLDEFAGMCDFHQSPESHFAKGKMCSRMIADGRITLTDKKFIINSDGNKNEIEVRTDDEFMDVLKREFGIER
jgi:N-hydroxyarylamine O-acetyltransferase